MLSLAVWFLTPFHGVPFAPAFTWSSHDQASGSDFNSQWRIAILLRRLDAPAPFLDLGRGEEARLGEGIAIGEALGGGLVRHVDDEERADHAVLTVEEGAGRQQD